MKKLIAVLLLVIAIMNVISVSANAETYIGSKDHREGGFLYIGSKVYTYRAYFDTNVIRFWYGRPLSHIVYHTKSSGSEELSISEETEISYSSTVSYNKAIGADVGIKQLISITAEKGYGVTTGISFSTTKVKTYTKTISSSSKTGFYMLAPSQTEKRCYWKKYQDNNSVYTGDTDKYYMPYGAPSVVCLYSSNNQNWSIFR